MSLSLMYALLEDGGDEMEKGSEVTACVCVCTYMLVPVRCTYVQIPTLTCHSGIRRSKDSFEC